MLEPDSRQWPTSQYIHFIVSNIISLRGMQHWHEQDGLQTLQTLDWHEQDGVAVGLRDAEAAVGHCC